MSYQIAPGAYGHMFGLPVDVVDKHIKLAGAVQLKVLLCLFAHPQEACDSAGLSKRLGLAAEDLADAMQYWISAGLVTDTENQQDTPAPPMPEPKPATHKEKPAAPIAKPTREEVVARGEQSEEIAWLLQQAQLRLGRTISVGEMATLVYLHDTEGLPAEVIAMILEYSISQGKSNIRYIEKVALSWAQQEIDTLEKAERKLSDLEKQRQAWNQVQTTFGMERRLPSEREQAMASRWVDEWHFSKTMLKAAYDVCADATGKCSLAYIDKVLSKWQKNGIRTPDQAKDERKSKTAKASGPQRAVSYDLDEIQKALSGNAEKDD